MDTKLYLGYDDGLIEYSTAHGELYYPRYAQVMNHVEMYGENILDYTDVPLRFGGIPDVFQLFQTSTQQPTKLTRELQFWMKRLFDECMADVMTDKEIVTCWKNTFRGMRAFTNKFGPDNGFADYIQGVNLDAEPMKLNPTICRGATIKVLRAPFMKGGVLISEFEVLDAFDPDTLTKTYKDNRDKIFAAINWSRCYIDFDKKIVDPNFPLGRAEPFPNPANRDVPIPLLGNHTNKAYIETKWLRFMDAGEAMPANPYWPGWM